MGYINCFDYKGTSYDINDKRFFGGGLLNLQIGFNTIATYPNYADVIVNANHYKIPKNFLVLVGALMTRKNVNSQGAIYQNKYYINITPSEGGISFNSYLTVSYYSNYVTWDITNIRLNDYRTGITSFSLDFNIENYDGSQYHYCHCRFQKSYENIQSYNTIPDLTVSGYGDGGNTYIWQYLDNYNLSASTSNIDTY